MFLLLSKHPSSEIAFAEVIEYVGLLYRVLFDNIDIDNNEDMEGIKQDFQ